MLFCETKKRAIAEYEKAVEKYKGVIETVRMEGERLYQTRKLTIEPIERSKVFFYSITDLPINFAPKLELIGFELKKFRQTVDYAVEAKKEAVILGDRIALRVADGVTDGVAIGVTGGRAFAEIAPDAVMWVTTTFGNASTGTAISTLSGAAKDNALLALLGGGPLAKGGGGKALGQARLDAVGPIAFLFVFAGTLAIVHACKNKKQAEQVLEKANELTLAAEQLYKTCADISRIHSESEESLSRVSEQYKSLEHLKDCNFVGMSNDEQSQFESLVNNSLALAQMLNKVVE